MFDYGLHYSDTDEIKTKTGSFVCFSYLICFQYIFLVAFPVIDSQNILNKSQIYCLDYYIVDIPFIENNPELSDQINENKYMQNEIMIKHLKEAIEEQFLTVFYRSVFQACQKDLEIDPFLVGEALSACNTNSFKISLSETFQILQKATNSLLNSKNNQFFMTKGYEKSYKKKSKKNLEENIDYTRDRIHGSSYFSLLLKQFNVSCADCLEEENVPIPHLMIIDKIFNKLIEFFFKKLKNMK